MLRHEWPANDYAIGSYIQATVANAYLSLLQLRSTDKVLDIGCGDGAFTTKILDKIPHGELTGIDRSENMLALAKKKIAQYPNFSVQQADVLSMTFNELFDYIVSFWCLQWSADITSAFGNIYRGLKKGGKFFTIFPSGDDPFMTTYATVKSTLEFPCLTQFIAPLNYQQLDHLKDKLLAIPFKQCEIERSRQSIVLPSFDVFRKFVNGIAFFHGQLSDKEISAVNEAMVRVFESDCLRKHQGEPRFEFSIYIVSGEK